MLKFTFIPLLDVILSKMGCLNPIVGTLLKGTRLTSPCGYSSRMWMSENETGWGYWKIQVFEGDWYVNFLFFFNLLATWPHTPLFLILSIARPLLTVHRGVKGCLMASIWRKPYLLQCDVHQTLSFWRAMKQLKNLNETAKAIRTVPGSWDGTALLKSKLL